MSHTAKGIVEELIQEGSDNLLRFDMSCRVEVWVTQEELEDSAPAREVANSTLSPEEKIKALKAVAAEIATAKIQAAQSSGGIEITCDGPSVSDINFTRMDWNALIRSDAEIQREEEAGFEV